jgi:hypothetical protein
LKNGSGWLVSPTSWKSELGSSFTKTRAGSGWLASQASLDTARWVLGCSTDEDDGILDALMTKQIVTFFFPYIASRTETSGRAAEAGVAWAAAAAGVAWAGAAEAGVAWARAATSHGQRRRYYE